MKSPACDGSLGSRSGRVSELIGRAARFPRATNAKSPTLIQPQPSRVRSCTTNCSTGQRRPHGRRTVLCRAGESLTGERDGGEQAGMSFWRGYYHKTGEAPPRLSFAAHWSAVLRTTHSSRVFRAIAKPLAANLAFALGVTTAYESGILTFALTPTAHTLMGVPLGLLLVLRITHAQERFWAGRCAWQVGHGR